MSGRRLRAGLTLVILAAACGGGGQAPTQAGPPIKVGAISSLTGPATFPEASQAAKAVFDRVNAQGGINGRKIEYTVEDDKADPAVAAQASRRLIEDQGVVAMVGSASLVDCAVNAPFYSTKNVVAIQGTGVDPVCFTSPNISPVNTGPYLGTTVALYYASNVLKRDKICSFLIIYGNIGPGYEEAIKKWEQLSGKKLLIDDRSLKVTGEDYTPYILRARSAGCQAVFFNAIEPFAIAWMKAVRAQNVTGIDWIMLTSVYTAGVVNALGSAGDGLIANSEFEPFTSNSPVLGDWRKLMGDNSVPLTSFAEGGYLAATIFVDRLKSIEGDINRDSVTQAFKSMPPYQSGLIGTPYQFGPAQTHTPNRASKFVEIKGGQWQVVTENWIVLPQ